MLKKRANSCNKNQS